MRVRSTLVLAAQLLWAPAAVAADWVAYTSDNFTVYSDAREQTTLYLIENFEKFRLAMLKTLDLPDSDESEHLVIVIFSRSRDYNSLAPSGTTGFFYHSVFGPRMMVGPSALRGTQETLFHEYVHYLVNRRSPLNYPRWYSEGLATVLSSTVIVPDSVLVGEAPQDYLNLILYGYDTTVENVVDLNSATLDFRFYATSWMLTHYLLIESFEDTTRKQQTVDYLRRYDAGEDPVEAFEASFGITPREMQREVMRYLNRNPLMRLTWPGLEYDGEIARRALAEDEALYLLGDLSVERDRYESAYEYFDDFEELGGDSPFRDNVRARRAIALIHEERVDEGDALIEPLLGTADADVLADIAHYAFDRFVYERDNADDPDTSHLARSIEYGERAVAAQPADFEALYYLGLAHEQNGNLQQAVDTLLEAYDISSTVPRLNASLARMLGRGGRPDLASYLVSRLYSASHSEGEREQIREMLGEIDSGSAGDAEDTGTTPEEAGAEGTEETD